jgi:hypothetical protein
MINFVDNFLPKETYDHVIKYCLRAPYYYGDKDNYDTPETGMVSKISSKNIIFETFDILIQNKIEEVKDFTLDRMYINCFAPREQCFYHTDGDSGITCLFYVNPDYKNVNDGGETQFIVENNSINILPIPNRLVIFNANILHRATPFKEKHRFTIAIKYT